ncbi:conjugal transfer protein TraH [Moritella viscosa]|uniref:conjugal transfer protein TraH n=1 Tax=Moritella viscosa TaxID=80854 RepID=UPI0009160E6A|nr:conjugal transfer protein TraH [Moritella viscosa]SGZ09490.1 Conjugative transfer protein TraH [Moritella viscosa]
MQLCKLKPHENGRASSKLNNKRQQVVKRVTHTLHTNSVHNRKLPLKIILLSASLALSTMANAGGANGSLNNFFNNLGYNANITNPNTFKGQTASYYNGGNLFVRSKIMTLTPFQLTSPSISAGCGGIDAFLGGFSHISSDELVQFGKSIIANAAPFAVNLALQTWAAPLKQIMGDLIDASDKWLNQSISSCETAQAAVEGLGAFASADVQKTVCSTKGTQDNAFSDWVGARQGCGAGGQSATQLKAARNDPALKDMTKTSHNIMWDALLEEPALSSDKALAEFFMALTGTVIYDAQGKSTYFPSLLTDNDEMIDTLLTGGKAETYRCDNRSKKKCLKPTRSTTTISSSEGLESRLTTKLDALHAKVMADNALSVAETKFVTFAEMPILNFTLSHAERDLMIDTDTYGRLIATELLTRYLKQSLNMAKNAIQNTAVDPKDVKLLLDAINRAAAYAKQLSREATADKLAIDKMIENAQIQQQTINASVSDSLRKNLNF